MKPSLYSLALGLAQGVYQCQTSSDPGGLVYTPNIPDAFFDQQYAADSSTGGMPTLIEARDGFTYFFTLPPLSPERNCSGTIVAIQFCYHADQTNFEIGEPQDIFEFLVTDREDRLFTITSSFSVAAASSESSCVVGNRIPLNTPHDCCTSFEPPNEQIPSSSFTFGIRILDTDFKPFVFRDSVLELRVEQFQTAFTYTDGDSFTLGEAVTNDALPLLRFLLGSKIITLCSYVKIAELWCRCWPKLLLRTIDLRKQYFSLFRFTFLLHTNVLQPPL